MTPHTTKPPNELRLQLKIKIIQNDPERINRHKGEKELLTKLHSSPGAPGLLEHTHSQKSQKDGSGVQVSDSSVGLHRERTIRA